MTPISGDTTAVAVTPGGSFFAHGSVLLQKTLPVVAGDSTAVVMAGEQWAYGATLEEFGVASALTVYLPAVSLSVTPQAVILPLLLPTVALTVTPQPVIPTWAAAGQFAPIYKLTLTGAADSTTDVTLPMASFQGRLRQGDPSYLSCVIPYTADTADDITARPNGEMVLLGGVRAADGTERLEEVARVALETIATDEGARNKSITISGHKTVTRPGKTRTLKGLTYRHAGTGPKRYRGSLDIFLQPGDTLNVDEYGESITVGLISYAVSPRRSTIEITEATG